MKPVREILQMVRQRASLASISTMSIDAYMIPYNYLYSSHTTDQFFRIKNQLFQKVEEDSK